MHLPSDRPATVATAPGGPACALDDNGGTLADEAVVDRVRGGETALYEILMRRYNQRLYRLARAMLGEDSEAEDVVQETYLRAFEHLGQFEGRGPFAAWLTRIAVHDIRARIRRRRRRSRLPDLAMTDLADTGDGGQGPAQRACAAELRHALSEALEHLPRPLRAVFVLREMEGLGTQETADCLGLTPANVKVRLHRARMQLRRSLEQMLGKEARSLYAFDGERCDRIVRNVLSRLS